MAQKIDTENRLDLIASISEEENNLQNQIEDWNDRVDERLFLEKHDFIMGRTL